jgi:hypothetical protein
LCRKVARIRKPSILHPKPNLLPDPPAILADSQHVPAVHQFYDVQMFRAKVPIAAKIIVLMLPAASVGHAPVDLLLAAGMLANGTD